MASDYCYRVVGHFGGMWDKTEWMATLGEAEQTFQELKNGNWCQLSIERTDGKRTLPGSDEWHEKEKTRTRGVPSGESMTLDYPRTGGVR